MSDVAIAQTDLPTGQPYLEQRLFGWSPLGLWPTAAVIFAVLYGLYLAAATFDGARTVFWSDHALHFENGAWPAFVLSLLITAALTMQRFTRLRDARDRSALGEIFSGGANTAARLSSYAPDDARLGRATLVGITLAFSQARSFFTIAVLTARTRSSRSPGLFSRLRCQPFFSRAASNSPANRTRRSL
jgi:hypothetical protein